LGRLYGKGAEAVMTIGKLRSAGLVVVSILSLGSAAHATTFVNGSFETGTDPGGSAKLDAGSGGIWGWTIGGNSIDYVGSGWSAQDGVRSIDLSGIGAGNIAQTFTTVAGGHYTVTFYLAGNPYAGPLVKTIRTSATGNPSQIDHFDATTSTHGNMRWVPITYTFQATGTSTTLLFASLNEGSAGPAIDNVSVARTFAADASVPEATTWVMMLGGFGMLGAMLRLRRTVGELA
jgi:choice-of-anchor C domain-containing protein